MTFNGWLQIAIYCALIMLFVKPFGGFMYRVFDGERGRPSPLSSGRSSARSIGAAASTRARNSTGSAMRCDAGSFSIAGFVTLYALQRLRGCAAVQSAGQGAVEQTCRFNTAVSFVTNTNWQAYGGETTMSYLTQMAGLTVHNFVSRRDRHRARDRADPRLRAARGEDDRQFLGRSDALHAVHPAAAVDRRRAGADRFAGMPQNLGAYTEASTLEGAKQLIAQGPVASQIAIKQLGTNGGGFFNVNSAHPFENPNALTNLIEMWAIICDQRRARPIRFGRMVRRPAPGLGDLRRRWASCSWSASASAIGRKPRQSGVRAVQCRSDRERLAARRQHGGQGGPLRHRQLGALGDRDHRRVLRRGQLHA